VLQIYVWRGKTIDLLNIYSAEYFCKVSKFFSQETRTALNGSELLELQQYVAVLEIEDIGYNLREE